MGRVQDDTQTSESTRLVRTEVRFTAEANEALDEIAKENGISKAQLIRYIVDNRMVDYLGAIRYIDSETGRRDTGGNSGIDECFDGCKNGVIPYRRELQSGNKKSE